MRSILRTALLVAFSLSITAIAYAQNVSVVGTVTDETKSVLPGVSVSATDIEAGRQFTAVTDTKGEYRLLNVPAGSYRIQAELSGFTTVVLAKVELLVGQNATIPFTLKIAQVSETLTVLGVPPFHTVVPWQTVTIAGFAATDVLSEPVRRRIEARLELLWPPGPHALATAAADSRLVCRRGFGPAAAESAV